MHQVIELVKLAQLLVLDEWQRQVISLDQFGRVHYLERQVIVLVPLGTWLVQEVHLLEGTNQHLEKDRNLELRAIGLVLLGRLLVLGLLQR